MHKKLIYGIIVLSLWSQIEANSKIDQYLLELEKQADLGRETHDFRPFANLFRSYGPYLERVKRDMDSSQDHRRFDLKDKYIRLFGGYGGEPTHTREDINMLLDSFSHFYELLKQGIDRENNFIKMLETFTTLERMAAYGRLIELSKEKKQIKNAIKHYPQLMANVDPLKYHWPYDIDPYSLIPNKND